MDIQTIATTPFKLANAAGLAIPALGAIWPGQGGRNAGLIRGENGPDYYVIPIDSAVVKALGKFRFGNRGDRVEGADHHKDGLANTLALINSGIAHPAAEACRAIVHEGHSDIYLAARCEAALVHMNASEDYPEEDIWTSTQYRGDDDYAWVQGFDSLGSQWFNYKDHERRVCPVRRLVLQ